MSRSGALLPFLVCLILAACASTPSVPVPPGSRVLVVLDPDGPGGLSLEFANASHPDLAGVYSQQRSSGQLKLAPDQLMGELLASLERNGLAEHGALSGELPESGASLLVEYDDQRTFLVRPESGELEAQQAWVRLKLTIDHYYQHVGALQYVANPEGRDVFREGGP